MTQAVAPIRTGSGNVDNLLPFCTSFVAQRTNRFPFTASLDPARVAARAACLRSAHVARHCPLIMPPLAPARTYIDLCLEQAIQ